MWMTHAKLLASVVFWGGTWISGRHLAQAMGPFSAAFLRFAVASAFLLFLTRRVHGKIPLPARRDLPGLAFLGLTGVFGYNAFFFAGLQTVPASRAALIVAAIPTVVSLYSGLARRERFGPARLCGIALSFCGAVTVLSRGDPLALLQGGISAGDLCILGCVACWAAYTLAGRAVMVRVTPLAAVTWSCLFGGAFLFPPALLGGLWADVAEAGAADWLHLIFLGIMATGYGFFWYYEGIQRIGASRAGIYINLVPVVAVLLGVFALDETVGPPVLLGGAMVLAGVWLAQRPKAA
ncbi:DMT family transporter [Desulfolutivibrio sulfoxidireducens]|uniref:DMT family transporter n=1 Tax=Desulfolutivibrio sulfoxidireducens TaxID=2773299 RepID=UPI00159DDC5A|nr:EamA family transporter [Desulfolutivibrio sulfoxidireducens]QLA20409.1 EamA family transporter [Desulfolutivibrio sulfoxidireducens]